MKVEQVVRVELTPEEVRTLVDLYNNITAGKHATEQQQFILGRLVRLCGA
jgi:hypothetical protein